MNRKPTNLVIMIFLVLAIALVGCRRAAAPPLEELTPEDEETAAMQEAEENTATMEADEDEPDAEETPEATEEPTPTEQPAEETAEPTAEPTETEMVNEDETATPEPTQAQPTTDVHVVQPGENLFRIALRYGTTVEALAKANNITNPSRIYVGQRLTIPSGTTPPSPSPGVQTYVVQPGDNLFRIALRHNYDQYYLARYNGIENPSMIYVGQVIRIP